MITIKLPIIEPIDISQYQKQYNNIVRYAHNRFIESKSQSEVEKSIKSTMNNIDLMDASLIKSATDSAKSLNNKEKVVFGSKKNWQDYNKGLKSKQEYQICKLKPIMVRGSKLDNCGNRKFKLDIIKNNRIIFKPKKGIEIYAKLPKTKHHSTLVKLQQLCELKQQYFTCALDNNYIYIIFDEVILKEKEYKGKHKRILALDLNPNYIAYVIVDNGNIIKKEIIGLKKLNDKGNANKKKFEDCEIVKRIIEVTKHYKVKHIVHEKLSINSSDKGKGKKFNKACNNN